MNSRAKWKNIFLGAVPVKELADLQQSIGSIHTLMLYPAIYIVTVNIRGRGNHFHLVISKKF